MPSDFKLRFYDTSGNPIGGELTRSLPDATAPDATKTGFLDLAYNSQCNDYGICKFTIPGNHRLVSSLVENVRVEVWRNFTDPNTGLVVIPFYLDWSGLFKDIDPWQFTGQEELFTAVCCSDLFWLQDRHIQWKTGTANRSTFSNTKAETMMKTIVDYNACANATAANGRERNGTITGLSIEADGARGNTLDKSFAYNNLLETLKILWPIAGGDYDLVKTSQTSWQFRWYTGQRGTDRSATVTFSLENGNMADPVYRLIRSTEKTVTVVGGQGEGPDRMTEVRTGVNFDVNLNNVETFTNATQETTLAGLDAAGDADLRDQRAIESLEFRVLQTPGSRYGLHYFLGDKVTAKFKTVNKTLKIQSVGVSFAGGTETIDVGLLNVL